MHLFHYLPLNPVVLHHRVKTHQLLLHPTLHRKLLVAPLLHQLPLVHHHDEAPLNDCVQCQARLVQIGGATKSGLLW